MTRGSRGGRRAGAGRPPKAVRYATQIAAQEAKLVAMLPELIELLMTAARAGDVGAQRYLVDRVLGRVQTQRAPIADDIALPMDHPGAAEHAQVRRRRADALELATPATGPEADAVLNMEHTLVEAELGSLADDERDAEQRTYIARKRGEAPRPNPLAAVMISKPSNQPSTKTALDGSRPVTEPSNLGPLATRDVRAGAFSAVADAAIPRG